MLIPVTCGWCQFHADFHIASHAYIYNVKHMSRGPHGSWTWTVCWLAGFFPTINFFHVAHTQLHHITFTVHPHCPSRVARNEGFIQFATRLPHICQLQTVGKHRDLTFEGLTIGSLLRIRPCWFHNWSIPFARGAQSMDDSDLVHGKIWWRSISGSIQIQKYQNCNGLGWPFYIYFFVQFKLTFMTFSDPRDKWVRLTLSLVLLFNFNLLQS